MELHVQVPRFNDDLGLAVFSADLRSWVFASQSQAAQAYGLSHTSVLRYEKGTMKPRVGYLASLACALQTRLADSPSTATVLLTELNRCIRFCYPGQSLLYSWADVEALADTYQKRTANPTKQAPQPQHTPRTTSAGPGFFGRAEELQLLTNYLHDPVISLVGIFGVGGVGKSTLVRQFTRAVATQFEQHLWYSLANAPLPEMLLRDLLEDLQVPHAARLPRRIDRTIDLLLEVLRTRRILIVFDNLESVLEAGALAGQYRPDYAGYETLLQQLGNNQHRSCVVLTSRERPALFPLLEGASQPVQAIQLNGLRPLEARPLLRDLQLVGDYKACDVLAVRSSGNPLVLKLVAEHIRELFMGDIAQYLAEGGSLFGDVGQMIEQQIQRLSSLEQRVLLWLAIERVPVSVPRLQVRLLHAASRNATLAALASLRRRSLIEREAEGFVLQHVILEYLTQRIVEVAASEVLDTQLHLLHDHALVLTNADESARTSQVRQLLAPTAERVQAALGNGVQTHFRRLIESLRQKATRPGYAAGNLLNLFLQLRGDPASLDLSGLVVRHALLNEAGLAGAQFKDTRFYDSRFTESFGIVLAVAFSPTGNLLAAGIATGEIHLWQLDTYALVQTLRGHTNWLRALAFSPDGSLLASASDDGTVRIWRLTSGKATICEGHTAWVVTVAFSPDGSQIASGACDGSIRFWNVADGTCTRQIDAQCDRVWSVAWSPCGHYLAAGGDDHYIRIWRVADGQQVALLAGHTSWVWTVAYRNDGVVLASGSSDQSIRLWDVASGNCITTLQGHQNRVREVVFAPQQPWLYSASDDETVRIWDLASGQNLKIGHGHRSWVWSVAANPAGTTIASGSNDQTVRVWTAHGQLQQILQGQTWQVWALALSPDGRWLISGEHDSHVRIWDMQSGAGSSVISGHRGGVRAVAIHPAGEILASAGEETAILLWNVRTGTVLGELEGHSQWIRTLAWSHDGHYLISGSEDHTVRVWLTATGECLHTLTGHGDWVRGVACHVQQPLVASVGDDSIIRIWNATSGAALNTFAGHHERVFAIAWSPHGQWLLSGGEDRTARLWSYEQQHCIAVLAGHTDRVAAVTWSPDGKIVATGSEDWSIRLWRVSDGQCIAVLHGHKHAVRALLFSPDGHHVISGSEDESIRIWDVATGACTQTLRSNRPYADMNISGAQGLSKAQRATLMTLGAVEMDDQRVAP